MSPKSAAEAATPPAPEEQARTLSPAVLRAPG